LGIQVNQTKTNHSEVVQVKQRRIQEREGHYYICFMISAVNRKHQSPSCSMQVERKVRKIEFELMIPFKNVPMMTSQNIAFSMKTSSPIAKM